MFGRPKTPPPTDAELRAARLTRPTPWTADGVSADVVIDGSRRRPDPLVLLAYDGGCLRLHLSGLERMVRGRQGVVENSADDAWLTDIRAISPDSPAGAVTRDVGPGHAVVISPGADPRRDPMRVYAVLTTAEVADLTRWARAAADAELTAQDRAGDGT